MASAQLLGGPPWMVARAPCTSQRCSQKRIHPAPQWDSRSHIEMVGGNPGDVAIRYLSLVAHEFIERATLIGSTCRGLRFSQRRIVHELARR